MFDFHRKADLIENRRLSCSLDEMQAKVLAISRSMAIIEFAPDGTILAANENFAGSRATPSTRFAASITVFSVKNPTHEPPNTQPSGVIWRADSP